MRGGFTLRVTYVRENRAYLNERIVDVPWTNKQLHRPWEHFRSKLEPGARRRPGPRSSPGPDAKKAVAEMVAGTVRRIAGPVPAAPSGCTASACSARNNRTGQPVREHRPGLCSTSCRGWPVEYKPVDLRYRAFPDDITANSWGYARPLEERLSGPARVRPTSHSL